MNNISPNLGDIVQNGPYHIGHNMAQGVSSYYNIHYIMSSFPENIDHDQNKWHDQDAVPKTVIVH